MQYNWFNILAVPAAPFLYPVLLYHNYKWYRYGNIDGLFYWRG